MTTPQPFAKLRRTARMLRPHAAGEGRSLSSGVLLGVAVVVLHVLRPWPLKWILDYLTVAHGGGALGEWMARSPSWGVVALVLLFVALATAEAGAEYGQVMVLNGSGNRVIFRFRAALFAHILRQPLAFHESRNVGELLTRVVYDTSRLRRGLNGFVIQIVQTVALFLATLAVLMWHHRALGIALAAGGLFALLTMRRRGRRIARAARKQRRKEGNLAAQVADELLSVRELQTFGISHSALLARFSRRNAGSLQYEQKVRRLAAGLIFRVDAILAVTVALAVGLGMQGILAGRMTPGDLVLFVSYAMSLRAPFTDFARQTARLGRTYACAERLAKLVELSPSIVDGPTILATPMQGSLAFESVSLKAPKRARGGRKWTLQDVSWELPAGRRVAIIGANGAGKSTLLRLALRLADPDKGRILLDGRDLREYTVDSVRRQVSVVFQHSVLSGLTVRENIAFGTPEASPLAVQAAAAAARAHGLIEGLPQGYDTPIRRGGNLFSGGERQRLALARAVLRDGRIWLLDEPTTGLDDATAKELVELLLELTRNRTVLWVTHDPGLVSRLDWVLVLNQGTVVFSGPSDRYHAQGSADMASAGAE